MNLEKNKKLNPVKKRIHKKKKIQFKNVIFNFKILCKQLNLLFSFRNHVRIK